MNICWTNLIPPFYYPGSFETDDADQWINQAKSLTRKAFPFLNKLRRDKAGWIMADCRVFTLRHLYIIVKLARSFKSAVVSV